MQTVFLLLCPSKPPVWSGKSQTTCWISCSAKALKVARNIVPYGNQQTIQHLALLKLLVHQKTNWSIQVDTIYRSIQVDTIYTCKPLCAGKRYSWCGVRCYNRAAINTFRSHLVQWFYVFRSHPSTYLRLTCALKSPIKTVDLVGDTWRRGSFTSSTKPAIHL